MTGRAVSKCTGWNNLSYLHMLALFLLHSTSACVEIQEKQLAG